MSNNKEDKTQAAAALFAAKGMSRAQAERAAAAQARNVNAYGQKEEGPSRWQERKEAKRQMYLMSTEKAVRLGERKDIKSSTVSSVGGPAAQCQKCFQFGHWTYECKNERVYMSRPSRTQQLKNPKLKMKLTVSYELDNPDIANEEKDKNGEKKGEKKEKGEQSGAKSKRKHRSRSDSEEDHSEASVFDTDGESSVTGSDSSSAGSSSSYTSLDSDKERRRGRKKRKQKKRRHQRYSSSSDSSDSESPSDSDSDDKGGRRKARRHSKRH